MIHNSLPGYDAWKLEGPPELTAEEEREQEDQHMNSLDDIYTNSLRGFRSEIERRRAGIAKSLRALPNPDSDYAKVHRKVAAVYDEVQIIVEKRLAEPAMTSAT